MGSQPTEADLIARTTVAIKELNSIYWLDRHLTMTAAVASFLLLFYIAVRAFSHADPPIALVASFFGASGFLTVAILRIAYFYNDGKKLIAEAVRAEISRMSVK